MQIFGVKPRNPTPKYAHGVRACAFVPRRCDSDEHYRSITSIKTANDGTACMVSVPHPSLRNFNKNLVKRVLSLLRPYNVITQLRPNMAAAAAEAMLSKLFLRDISIFSGRTNTCSRFCVHGLIK